MKEQEVIRIPLYKVGDKVKIVNYGHNIFSNIHGKLEIKDISPEMIGQYGVIREAHLTQNIPKYALSGVKGKVAWYDEGQLKLIKRLYKWW